MNQRAGVYGGRFPYLASGRSRGQWRLVGHNKAAMLIVENTAYREHRLSIMMFFGDFPSIAQGDTGNFMIWLGYVSSGYDDNNGYISSQQDKPHGLEGPGGAAVTYYKSYDGVAIGQKGSASSLFAGHRGVSYPDPITSGLMVSECYLQEYINDNQGQPIRGLWPGLYLCNCDLTGKPLFSMFSGFDGTDDEYLMFVINYSYKSGEYPFFVNTTAWLA